AAFGVYLLGFRVANAPSAPLGAVVLRWGLARLGPEGHEERSRTHRRAATGLFLLGVAALAATVAVALVLPELIGERWRGAAAIAAIIAIALPWRLVDGLIGALGFTVDEGPLLVRFEAARLVSTAVAL